MKITVFIVLVITCYSLIPDSWIRNLLMPHHRLSVYGGEAMSDYDFTVILLKFCLTTLIVLVLRMLKKFLNR